MDNPTPAHRRDVAATPTGRGPAPALHQHGHRTALLARYRQLVLHDLPRLAHEGQWVVTNDHCLGRIVLDVTVGGRWYDVLARGRSPAYAQLDDDALARAVDLAERMADEGDPLVRELNARSLAWRRAARPDASI